MLMQVDQRWSAHSSVVQEVEEHQAELEEGGHRDDELQWKHRG